MSTLNANLSFHFHIMNIFSWHYNQIVNVDHLKTTLQGKFPLPSILSAQKNNYIKKKLVEFHKRELR